MPDQTSRVTARREPRRNEGSPSWGRWAVVGAAAIILAVIFIAGVNLTAQTLALLFAAIVIAEAIVPLIDKLEQWMPRGVAVGVVYLLLIAIMIGALWYVVPDVINQATNLAGRIPEVADDVTDAVDDVTQAVEDSEAPVDDGVMQDVEDTVRDSASQFMTAIVTFSGTLVSSVTQLLLILFMSAYWLISRSALFDFIRSLAPKDQQHAVNGTLDAFSETVGGYVRGVGISAVFVGTVTYIGLLIIGVEYALVLALLAAFGELLPLVGPFIAAVPAVIVALFGSPTQALIVAVFYLVLQQIESNIVLPNVMSNQADVPPLLTLAAITAGGTIGGILGAVIAIPFAGVIKVVVSQIAAPGIRRWTGATQAPTTVDEAVDEAQEE